MVTGIEQGIQATIRNSEGLHYINSPQRGIALLRQLQGTVAHLTTAKNDDPLLFACNLLDQLPQIARHVLELEKWAHAINEATPDQIDESGAL